MFSQFNKSRRHHRPLDQTQGSKYGSQEDSEFKEADIFLFYFQTLFGACTIHELFINVEIIPTLVI